MNISWNAVLTIWRTFLEIHISRSLANRPAWHLNPNKCAFTLLSLTASSSHHLPATPLPVILSAHIITSPSNDFLFLYFAFKPNHKLMGRENSRFSCLFPTSQDLGAWEELLLSQELVLTSQDLLRKVTGVLPWTHHWLIFIGVPEGPPEGPSHQRAPQGSGNWLSFQLDERPTTGVSFPTFSAGSHTRAAARPRDTERTWGPASGESRSGASLPWGAFPARVNLYLLPTSCSATLHWAVTLSISGLGTVPAGGHCVTAVWMDSKWKSRALRDGITDWCLVLLFYWNTVDL